MNELPADVRVRLADEYPGETYYEAMRLVESLDFEPRVLRSVVFLAGGAADVAEFTTSPFDGGLTMTAGMASMAKGSDNVVGEGLTFQSLYFVGLVLFVLTLALNIAAGRFVNRVREKY